MSHIEEQSVLLVSDQAIEIADLEDYLARRGASRFREVSSAAALEAMLETGEFTPSVAFVGLRDSAENVRCVDLLLGQGCHVVAIDGAQAASYPPGLARMPRPFSDGALSNALRALGFTD